MERRLDHKMFLQITFCILKTIFCTEISLYLFNQLHAFVYLSVYYTGRIYICASRHTYSLYRHQHIQIYFENLSPPAQYRWNDKKIIYAWFGTSASTIISDHCVLLLNTFILDHCSICVLVFEKCYTQYI